jgi:glycosyltransferase involved in cell wall biosynthesis
MMKPILIAVPVFNEEKHLPKVLREIRAVSRRRADILVVNDGSTDRTAEILHHHGHVAHLNHDRNLGYGASLIDAFNWAARRQYSWVITMDCDEQHEPARLHDFFSAIDTDDADIISGSRYMNAALMHDLPPADRRRINMLLTDVVNRNLNLDLTDTFCGYKAHRVEAVRRLKLTEPGYAFPMQFWVLCARAGLAIRELPVDLIYNDPNRHFGGQLDNPDLRLRHYLNVFFTALNQTAPRAVMAAAC